MEVEATARLENRYALGSVGIACIELAGSSEKVEVVLHCPSEVQK